MNARFLSQKVIVLFILLGFILIAWLPVISFSTAQPHLLTVRFLDVGQGDAIHIITPDGYEMLIDGGSSALVLRELAKGRSFFDRTIDVVLATHPDTDHVGGLVDVLDRYQVGMIIESVVDHTALAAQAFDKAALAEGVQIIAAQAGQELQLGASTTIRILSPSGDTTNWQSNNASVIVQVIYGDIEFMLTGDAPSSIEDFLVIKYGESLESDVLKLGHHGSKTSSSELFLSYVRPRYSVVSAGADNRYGHPNQTVIDRVASVESEIVSTATVGTITFLSNGMDVWLQ
jgi:competence protein ComEC